MKLVAVLGSPHPNGPSSTLAKEVIRGAKEAGWEISLYEIESMRVRGCQGCRVCKQKGIDCVVKDDLTPYWKDLHTCDALLVSSPNYASTVTGPMITYMNRHYCLLDENWQPRINPGIKLIGVFAQGAQDASLYQKNYEWFLHDFENRGMVLQHMFVHTGGGPATEDERKRAFEAGYTL